MRGDSRGFFFTLISFSICAYAMRNLYFFFSFILLLLLCASLLSLVLCLWLLASPIPPRVELLGSFFFSHTLKTKRQPHLDEIIPLTTTKSYISFNSRKIYDYYSIMATVFQFVSASFTHFSHFASPFSESLSFSLCRSYSLFLSHSALSISLPFFSFPSFVYPARLRINRKVNCG